MKARIILILQAMLFLAFFEAAAQKLAIDEDRYLELIAREKQAKEYEMTLRKREKEILTLTDKLASNERMGMSSQQKLSGYQERLRKQEEQIESLKLEVDALLREYDDARRSLAQSRETIQILKKKNEVLNEELQSQSRGILADQKDEKAKWEKEKRALMDQNYKLEARTQALIDKTQDLEMLLNQKTKELSNSKIEIKELKRENSVLKKELVSRTDRKPGSTQANQDEIAELKVRYRKELYQKDIEIKVLKSRIQALEKKTSIPKDSPPTLPKSKPNSRLEKEINRLANSPRPMKSDLKKIQTYREELRQNGSSPNPEAFEAKLNRYEMTVKAVVSAQEVLDRRYESSRTESAMLRLKSLKKWVQTPEQEELRATLLSTLSRYCELSNSVHGRTDLALSFLPDLQAAREELNALYRSIPNSYPYLKKAVGRKKAGEVSSYNPFPKVRCN